VSDTQLCQWATDRNGTFLGERRGLRQAPRLLLPAQITVDTSPDGEFGGKRVQLVLSIDGFFGRIPLRLEEIVQRFIAAVGLSVVRSR
jgi:hypothetical protein